MNNNLSETNFSEVHEQSAKSLPVTEPKVQTLITSTLESNMTKIPSEENPQIKIPPLQANEDNAQPSYDLSTARNFVSTIITLLQEFLKSSDETGETNTPAQSATQIGILATNIQTHQNKSTVNNNSPDSHNKHVKHMNQQSQHLNRQYRKRKYANPTLSSLMIGPTFVQASKTASPSTLHSACPTQYNQYQTLAGSQHYISQINHLPNKSLLQTLPKQLYFHSCVPNSLHIHRHTFKPIFHSKTLPTTFIPNKLFHHLKPGEELQWAYTTKSTSDKFPFIDTKLKLITIKYYLLQHPEAKQAATENLRQAIQTYSYDPLQGFFTWLFHSYST